MGGYDDEAREAARPMDNRSPINTALDGLDKELAELSATIAALRDRLEPVLANSEQPAPSRIGGEDAKPMAPVMSPVQSRVRGAATTIFTVTQSLQSLVERLET